MVIGWDKTMEDKMMYIPNNKNYNCPFVDLTFWFKGLDTSSLESTNQRFKNVFKFFFANE